MEVYRRDTRGRSLLLMLVVTSLVLVTLDSGNNGLVNTLRAQAHSVISPIQSLVDDAFSPLRNIGNGITKYSAVRDENARLKRQIADLRAQQLRPAASALPSASSRSCSTSRRCRARPASRPG